ncbi:MAG: cysteine--tRNA ligase [Bacteroidota bacterium]
MTDQKIKIYNTLSRKTEDFQPIQPLKVGLYVCGPTVYGPAHLGHARSAVFFDIVVRTFKHLHYQVKYIRNITDVGHLVGEVDQGEDKISRIARIEQISPMQVAYKYTQSYEKDLQALHVLPPDIAPLASGHITEQINCVKHLLKKEYAYLVNGSVYFDIAKYHAKNNYGILSGRKIQDLISGTRLLAQQGEKKNQLDFALWKKAKANHLMRWPSPWGEGFPGWHLECTSMSTKYLGPNFDIHGGGLDLSFPHNECEIAQSQALHGMPPANYWMHNNLVTIANEKMSKSAGNFITLTDCFQGTHPLLSQAYPPIVIRFFLLQAHYRTPLSFSDQAVQAAKKGYYKLLNTYKTLQSIHYPTLASPHAQENQLNLTLSHLCHNAYQALYNDFNTAQAIGYLFDIAKYINAIDTQQLSIHQIPLPTWQKVKTTYFAFFEDLLGLNKPPAIDAAIPRMTYRSRSEFKPGVTFG